MKLSPLVCRAAFLVAVLVASRPGAAAGADSLRLRYAIGMADGALETDGVTFTIELTDAEGGTAVLAERHHAEHAWADGEIDLSAHDGRTVILRFLTGPGTTTTYDWGCWEAPRIIRDEKVLVNLGETRIWRTGLRLPSGEEVPMDSTATGASFRLGPRRCGGETRSGFLAHPPYRRFEGGKAFAEYRLTLGDTVEAVPARGILPVRADGDSPFPMGVAPCFRVSSPLVIDGDTGDWPADLRRAFLAIRSKQQMSVEVSSYRPGWKGGWTGPRDLSSTLFLAWDEVCLYVAEIRRDDKLVFMDTMTQDFLGSDALRLCLTPEPRQRRELSPEDLVLALLPEGEEDRPMIRRCSYGGGPDAVPEGVRLATTLCSDGWVLEAALPFAALGVRPAPGQTLGFQVVVTDSDTPMDRHYEMLWRPRQGPDYWRDPSQFGRIALCVRGFAWAHPGRDLFALGEAPALAGGVFSRAGSPAALLDAVFRGADGSRVALAEGVRLPSGGRVECNRFPALGRGVLETVLRVGEDTCRAVYPVTVVEDRVRDDLGALVQPGEPTLVPSPASRAFRNTVTADGDAFRLCYEGEDERLCYRVRPAAGLDVRIEVGGEVIHAADPGRSGPQVVQGAGIGEAGAWSVAALVSHPAAVAYRVRRSDGLEVAYEVGIEGKTLVLEARSDAGAFSGFRGPLHGFEGEPIFVPYLDPRLGVALAPNGSFVSSWCDWTFTGASRMLQQGGTEYQARTDGTRNPLRERVLVTVSRD
ncbi:MAG: hypothetical protein JXR77_16260, partial [Lentisphaeria bacterium]|nr:hypothetical protein [Lentisphaeria bacterium]